MNRIFRFSILLALFGCSSPPVSETKVVATTSIIADWVQNIAGDRLQVVSLVGRDGDAHNYEPTPQDSVTLQKSALIVMFGAGMEHSWLDGLLDSSGTTAARLVLSEKIGLLPSAHEEDEHEEDEHEEDHEGEEHAEEEHSHGEFDPHIWMSLVNAMQLVPAIKNQLIILDPEGQSTYETNASAYVAELEALHLEIAAQAAAIPEANRKLVVPHRSFGYFARDYGLEQVGSMLKSISTEGGDPSAGDLAALVQTIRSQNIRAVFDENIGTHPYLATVAREAGITVAPTLYTDALGQTGTPGETYLGMMRYNARIILEALR